MAQIFKPLPSVTVATAGIPVSISASQLYASSLTVTADSLNTGKIYVGDSTVTSSNGVELSPGQTLSISCDEIRGNSEGVVLSEIFVDTATNGNKARITYLARR